MRNTLKRISGLLAVVILLGLTQLSSLRHTDEIVKKDKPLIGISMCSLLTERWYKDQEELTAELGRLGADVIVQNANNQQELQNQQIERLVEQGIDVLILIPVSSSGCRTAVEKARGAGVKVIAYERLVLNTNIDLYMSFDNRKLGELMGQGLLDCLSGGQVVLINGDDEDYNSHLYREGYMSVLQPEIQQGTISVVQEFWADDWTKEAAYEAIRLLLDNGVRIDGIIAGNDSLAEMSIQALSEKELAGKTAVIGQDGDLSAYQRIVFGLQTATVYKAYPILARKTALAAYRMAKGAYFSTNGTFSNGAGEMPCYLVDSNLITLENIDREIVGKGVYSQEEVYSNIEWMYV